MARANRHILSEVLKLTGERNKDERIMIEMLNIR
jgi:hypothetical protein